MGVTYQEAQYTLSYVWPDGDREAGAAARRFLRSILGVWGLVQRTADDVELAASELISNAAEHAKGPYELLLRGTATQFVCAVRDCDPYVPVTPSSEAVSPALPQLVEGTEELAERGRGLRIVEHLFPGAWGFRPLGDGTKLAWIGAWPGGGEEGMFPPALLDRFEVYSRTGQVGRLGR